MMIALHKNATTTPAVRAQIQQSSASEYELAQRYHISRTTVQRWKHRASRYPRVAVHSEFVGIEGALPGWSDGTDVDERRNQIRQAWGDA